jgi:hypothetical protein
MLHNLPSPVHARAGADEVVFAPSAYERRSKNRPQSAARAVLCGGVKVVHRRNLVP